MSTAIRTPINSTSDLHVVRYEPLPAPTQLLSSVPLSEQQKDVVARGRSEVQAVLNGVDDRLLVVVGPCSIHDAVAGLDYAARLASLAQQHHEDLLVVMRTYFEKPRSGLGWKGLINDPHLDGSHDIAAGLSTARRFLCDVTDLGLPCATEFLEPISPQYTADLISWGAVGARTSESQVHRQMVSGLSMPVGFKNGTDGGLAGAIAGCAVASSPQRFLGIDGRGRAALVTTSGNSDTHLVLRGSTSGPNYSRDHVADARHQLLEAGVNPRVVIDASHGNSAKSHHAQLVAAREIAGQVGESNHAIAGIMLESFLVAGSQRLDASKDHPPLTYGQSVTDECLDWDTTAALLDTLARSAHKSKRG